MSEDLASLARKSSQDRAAELESRRRHDTEEARIAFLLQAYGDEIARREGYAVHRGNEAVAYYLTQTHGLPPATARTLSVEDRYLLLAEAMQDWDSPSDVLAISDSMRVPTAENGGGE